MKSSPRNDAKRYIYRILALTLQDDVKNGLKYLNGLTTDSSCFSSYEGKKISPKTLSDIVEEITEELNSNAGIAPPTIVEKYQNRTKTEIRYDSHFINPGEAVRIGFAAIAADGSITWLGKNVSEMVRAITAKIREP